MVSGRLPSSRSSVTACSAISPVALSCTSFVVGQRHDLVVEAAGLLGRGGALLALQRVLVLRLAADRRSAWRRSRRSRSSACRARACARRATRRAERCVFMCSFCTRLIDSSPPATITGTPSTITRCAAMRDRLQARRAEAVDGRAARRHRQPGADRRLARDVVAGRAFGHARSRGSRPRPRRARCRRARRRA